MPQISDSTIDKKSEELRDLVMSALDELKADKVVVLEVHALTAVTDFMIIASGRSSRQVRAIADNVVTRAKKNNTPPLGIEGLREGEWVLVDLNDVVVHVMQPEIREFYQLEKLWVVNEASDFSQQGSGR